MIFKVTAVEILKIIFTVGVGGGGGGAGLHLFSLKTLLQVRSFSAIDT